jgi:hypothetical protein
MPRGVKSTLRITSGGQTGADRAALDWAIQQGKPHGGWCPKGRLAEDGTIPKRYRLRQTPSAGYDQRTEWNVRDSDGTVIFTIGPGLSGGSLFTAEMATKLSKPCLHLSRAGGGNAATRLKAFLGRYGIKALNVAGPRASSEPMVGEFVRETLESVLNPDTCVSSFGPHRRQVGPQALSPDQKASFLRQPGSRSST